MPAVLRVTFDVCVSVGDAQSAVAGSIQAEERSSRDRVRAAAVAVASQLPAESGMTKDILFLADPPCGPVSGYLIVVFFYRFFKVWGWDERCS